MTKAMPKTNLPRECWVFSKGKYIQLARGFEIPGTTLPYVNLEHEEILKANDIPYRKTRRTFGNTSVEVLEFWNPDEEPKQRDVTLPLFAEVPGGYTYCGRNYTGKKYTSETVDSLKIIRMFVADEIERDRRARLESELYKYAKAKLAGNVSTVCRAHVALPYQYRYDINMNNDNFMILRVVGVAGLSDWVGIFDMNKLAKDCIIHLQVPQHIAGLIIGKSGSRIKLWAEMLGVKKIQVVPV